MRRASGRIPITITNRMDKLKTVAVLGGLGFIGSHICRALVASGVPVRVIDREDSPRDRVRDIEHLLDIRTGDVTRVDEILSALADTSTLIHLVHSTVPQGSMSDPAADIIDNVASVARLAARLGMTDIERIVFISSGGAVYGVNDNARIAESEPTNPISSYGVTKLANEKYLAMYAATHGIRCLIVRPANIYGPQQRLDKGQGVIGTLVDRSLRGEPIEIWGTGEVVRDYLYIDDMVAGILALLEYGGSRQIFNIGSGVGHSVSDILSLLGRHLGKLPEVMYKPARGFDVPSNVLDTRLLETETNWKALVPLDEGISRVIASFHDHE